MSAAWVAEFGFGLVFLATVIATVFLRKRILRSTGGVHRFKTLSLILLLVLGALALVQFYLDPSPQKLVMVVGWGILGLILYFQLSKGPTESESRQQYELDPGHCGRCGYDLTGNVSGICPECGWKLAEPLAQYERPEWAQWWRRWEIEYLDNWKRTLAFCFLCVVMFTSVALWLLLVKGAIGFGIIALLMALNFVINAGRVGVYARKRHRQPPH